MAKSGSARRLKQVAEHEWVFDGPELTGRDLDQFDVSIELLGTDPDKAAKAFRSLLTANPHAIDVRHHLAIAHQLMGRDDEAMAEWTRAVELGSDALPPGFTYGLDRLAWGWLPNRPFLRALHGLTTALRDEGLLGEAILIYNNLLDLNPDDNQGVRMELVSACFAVRRPADVLRVCERYPDDMPDLVFGKALALFQLGREEEAEAAYREAAQAWPLVHAELLKTRHTEPPLMSGFISMGGADQAFAYWEEHGPFWKATRGALAMARRLASAPAPRTRRSARKKSS
jgi:tetratricopeptide (TPR) repeat protein